MAIFIDKEQAAKLIKDNDVLGVGGFCGFGAPDTILSAIGKRFETEKSPKNLTIINPAGAGSGDDEPKGLSAIGEEGLIKNVITSVIMLPKKVLKQINENKIACFCPPLGYFGHMFRALAGKEPGFISHTGLNTYCDPRYDGCKMNDLAKQSSLNIVNLVSINNEKYLFYPTFKMNVCILRGTFADEEGNISISHEAILSENLEMASAVHNNGGIVIFEVEKIVQKGTINPREVVVHKSSVDYIVVSDPGNHLQSYAIKEYRPELVGEIKVPNLKFEKLPLTLKKVIARRAIMEVKKNALVNLGLGLSENISYIASEEGVLDDFTISIETGIMGGLTLTGGAVGAGINAEAYYKMPDTFDLYNGGGLDQTFLSAAEIDEEGNVNVSKFDGLVNGPGGFINISQNTKEVYFSCIFTAGKTNAKIENGEISIIQDSPKLKFVKKVKQITFSGKNAIEKGQKVMYITERGVFRLTKNGLELIEIAKGINLEKDILAKMEFVPKISSELKLMDERIFLDSKMDLVLKERVKE